MNTSPTFDTVAQAAAPTPAPARRLSTDAPTRMFHWLFALSFAGAYLTAESEHWRLMHVTLGYSFAGLLVFRLIYGLVGPRQARLGLLWRKLSAAPAWLRSLTTGEVPNWRQGQNLAMALAVWLMIGLVLPLTLSGYATYNDWGDVFGGDWIEETHEFFGNAFLAVVLGHLGLIAALSALRRQNMARPMWSGRLPGKGPSPVQHNRAWLAAVLLLAVLAFGAWQWVDSPRGLLPAAGWSAHQDDDED